MCVLNITDDYEFLFNCTNNDINIVVKNLLLSITTSIILLCHRSLLTWTMIKLSLTNKG